MAFDCPCTLITDAALRRQLPQLQPNLHPDELRAALQVVHNNDLPEAITDCLPDLCEAINTETLSPEQEALLAELEPLLAWRVFYRYLEAWPVEAAERGNSEKLSNTLGYLSVGSRRLDRVSAMGLASARCTLYQDQFEHWLADNYASLACLQTPKRCSDNYTFTGLSGSAS